MTALVGVGIGLVAGLVLAAALYYAVRDARTHDAEDAEAERRAELERVLRYGARGKQ